MKERFTVRRLINEAYRASTLRGIGDVPSADEAYDALVDLNSILDELSDDPEFNNGKKEVEVLVTSKGYVTISDDPSRIVVSAVVDANPGGDKFAELHTAGEHLLKDGSSVSFVHANGMFVVANVEVIDQWSFKGYVHPTVPQGAYTGVFTIVGEPVEKAIDIVDTPPVSIFKVYDVNGDEIRELEEQEFYGRRSGRYWFYDKRQAPYPKVWIGGCSKARIVYTEPFWNGLCLDTDITLMPASARQAIKWRLSSMLAESQGFIDIADRLMKRYRECYALFCESTEQNWTMVQDASAPGFGYAGYDIRTDGGR